MLKKVINVLKISQGFGEKTSKLSTSFYAINKDSIDYILQRNLHLLFKFHSSVLYIYLYTYI